MPVWRGERAGSTALPPRRAPMNRPTSRPDAAGRGRASGHRPEVPELPEPHRRQLLPDLVPPPPGCPPPPERREAARIRPARPLPTAGGGTGPGARGSPVRSSGSPRPPRRRRPRPGDHSSRPNRFPTLPAPHTTTGRPAGSPLEEEMDTAAPERLTAVTGGGPRESVPAPPPPQQRPVDAAGPHARHRSSCLDHASSSSPVLSRDPSSTATTSKSEKL